MTQEQPGAAWRCDKCGEHMIWHGLRDGTPICPPKNVTEHPTPNAAEVGVDGEVTPESKP